LYISEVERKRNASMIGKLFWTIYMQNTYFLIWLF